MNKKTLKYRWLLDRLNSSGNRRIVVITGARQTGKTTLVRLKYPDLNYINLDSIEDRQVIAEIRTGAWARVIGEAVIDEAQKEPSVFEKVKWAFDQGEIDFTVLTGSSRILLLSGVKETMAGRAFLFDLWPLMASELLHDMNDRPAPPLIHRLVQSDQDISHHLKEESPVLLSKDEEAPLWATEHLAMWGGMPELLFLEKEERRQWLSSYLQTFLERDLADLARIRDLSPFLKLQRLAMLRSGQLLSYSELARDAGISVNTAKRFLEYLKISYQAVLLKPWSRNLTSRVIKAPKLYWLDMGILRQGTRRWGEPDGNMFETLVVGEIYKWVKTMCPDTGLYFYRTRSGMETDLVLEMETGIIGMEIKNRKQVNRADFRSLRVLAQKLGDEWKGGIVVYSGREIISFSEEYRLWAVPLHRLIC
ncbi:MAG: hypothetical protein DSZ23_04400 [Thermodesulfatator sp.]|nr:MAG: hypothetical protein DSZ23_04400 [Thermodesulfatator sp.]